HGPARPRDHRDPLLPGLVERAEPLHRLGAVARADDPDQGRRVPGERTAQPGQPVPAQARRRGDHDRPRRGRVLRVPAAHHEHQRRSRQGMTPSPTPPQQAPQQAPQHPVQPLLSDAVIALRAPTQVWSGRGGDLGAAPIDGIYHGDVRHVRDLVLECAESAVEYVSLVPESASHVVFGALLRGADDARPDPTVRLVRDRRVGDGALAETWTVTSHLAEPTRVTLRLRLHPDFASMHDVKAGLADERDDGTDEAKDPARVTITTQPGSATAASGSARFTLTADGAEVSTTPDDGAIQATWSLDVPARGQAEAAWALALHDDTLEVRGAQGTWPTPDA